MAASVPIPGKWTFKGSHFIYKGWSIIHRGLLCPCPDEYVDLEKYSFTAVFVNVV